MMLLWGKFNEHDYCISMVTKIFYNKAKTKLDRKVEKDSKSATNLFQCGINAKIRTVAEAYNFSLSLGCSLLESSFIR